MTAKEWNNTLTRARDAGLTVIRSGNRWYVSIYRGPARRSGRTLYETDDATTIDTALDRLLA